MDLFLSCFTLISVAVCGVIVVTSANRSHGHLLRSALIGQGAEALPSTNQGDSSLAWFRLVHYSVSLRSVHDSRRFFLTLTTYACINTTHLHNSFLVSLMSNHANNQGLPDISQMSLRDAPGRFEQHANTFDGGRAAAGFHYGSTSPTQNLQPGLAQNATIATSPLKQGKPSRAGLPSVRAWIRDFCGFFELMVFVRPGWSRALPPMSARFRLRRRAICRREGRRHLTTICRRLSRWGCLPLWGIWLARSMTRSSPRRL